jgi:hypothetical protein
VLAVTLLLAAPCRRDQTLWNAWTEFHLRTSPQQSSSVNHLPRPQFRIRYAGLLALLLLVVGWSVHGLAQTSAPEHALLGLLPAAAAHSARTPAPKQWCTVLHDAPPGEVSALEAETDSEPVAPELPSMLRPGFGCTAKIMTAGRVLQAATGTYTVRFAASPVLARAPPRSAR